jgi:hypothetical protein
MASTPPKISEPSIPLASPTLSSERKGKRKADDHGEPLSQPLSGGTSEHTTKRPKLSYEVDDNQNKIASRTTKNASRRARVYVTAAAAEEVEVPLGGTNVKESSGSSAGALYASQKGIDVTTAPTRKPQKPRKSQAKNKDAHPSGTSAPHDGIDQSMVDAPPYATLSNFSAGVAASNSKTFPYLFSYIVN